MSFTSNPADKGAVDISVVIPLHNEEKNVEELCRRVCQTLDLMGASSELVLVDDGSSDGSFEKLKQYHQRDSRIKIIRFVRNFGQHIATLAGLTYARGNVIVTMDGDLQVDPEDMQLLIAKLNEGYEVVNGCRVGWTAGSLMRRIGSAVIDWLNGILTRSQLEDSVSTFKAYRRKTIEGANLRTSSMVRFLPTYVAWMGYKVGEVKVTFHRRKEGKSSYHLLSLTRLLVDWFYTFSDAPILFYIASGGAIAAALLCMAMLVVALAGFATGRTLLGLSSVFAAVFSALTCIILLVLAILHERVTLIHWATMSRPEYAVAEVLGEKTDENHG